MSLTGKTTHRSNHSLRAKEQHRNSVLYDLSKQEKPRNVTSHWISPPSTFWFVKETENCDRKLETLSGQREERGKRNKSQQGSHFFYKRHLGQIFFHNGLCGPTILQLISFSFSSKVGLAYYWVDSIRIVRVFKGYRKKGLNLNQHFSVRFGIVKEDRCIRFSFMVIRIIQISVVSVISMKLQFILLNFGLISIKIS